MASSSFRSPSEFREVIDQIFGLMDGPGMGPQLRDADVPQRFEFEDLDLVVNVRAARADEDGRFIVWEWSDDVDWEPKVRMEMSSETANKYFQGKENIAMAIARRRIKTGGDIKAALALMPVVKPVYAQYVALVERDYPHLKV
jgi:SCP-2 sterol transfer family